MWSNLSLDAGGLVLDEISDADVGRFSLVCKNWRRIVDRWLKVDEHYITLSVRSWMASGETDAFRYLLYHPSNRVSMERWLIIIDGYRRESDPFDLPKDLPLRDIILDRYVNDPNFLVRTVRTLVKLAMPFSTETLERYIIANPKVSQNEFDEIMMTIIWQWYDPYRFVQCFDLILHYNEDLHIFADLFYTHTQYTECEPLKRWVDSQPSSAQRHSQKRKRMK